MRAVVWLCTVVAVVRGEDIASRPYDNYLEWGSPQTIDGIRRALSGDKASTLSEKLVSKNSSTWNTIKAGSQPGADLDATVRVVGYKFCPPTEFGGQHCQPWQQLYVNGHLAIISNPVEHFSVLPPPAGCGTVSKVSSTTIARKRQRNILHHGCKIAVNAGFFMRHVHGPNGTSPMCTNAKKNCACLGNLVSEGKILQTTNWMNVNFGLRNGKFVVGYLTKEEVLDEKNPFQELVAGVIWLVRNGTNFALESAKIENPTAQQTSERLMEGNRNSFVDTFAARTAVGYDKDGRLLIFQLDGLHGRSYIPDGLKRGIDLVSFADLLIKAGFVEAINLDGGGSSAFVIDDDIDSYPSDQCAENGQDFVCERPVSSMLCVHDDNEGVAEHAGHEGNSLLPAIMKGGETGGIVIFIALTFVSLTLNVFFGYVTFVANENDRVDLFNRCRRHCACSKCVGRKYSQLETDHRVTIDVSGLEIEIPVEEFSPPPSPEGTPTVNEKKKLLQLSSLSRTVED